MESAHVSFNPVSIVERSGAAARFLTAVSEEQRFDRQALLRWADDGGRWAEKGDYMHYEVRV